MLTIGTRGSDLALSQAHWVSSKLAEQGIMCRIEVIRTKGDKLQTLSFDKIEGKGFFTKEIEEALLEGHIDVAVHSHKDLPTTSPDGLCVAAIPEREDPRDCLVMNASVYDPQAESLPLQEGARVGSGAVRRRSQLQTMRKDLQMVDLRGNVPTRVRKLREGGQFDATLIACAGLNRLGFDLGDLVSVPLDPELFVPAPGQGALALQVRESDTTSRDAVTHLNDAMAEAQVRAERGLLARLEGGCQLPLGAHVRSDDAGLRMTVFFGGNERSPGARRLTLCCDNPENLAERAYRELVAS